VPLATYTGWNFNRAGGEADPDALVPLAGSYIPFAATAQQRQASGDPRLSIGERYASKDAYLQRVRREAETLVEGRYLLAPDVEPIVVRAGAHWDLLTAE
jgi:hypothetical protein